MKPNLFLYNYKNYRLKYRTPKFEMSRIKIGDFMSAESWAILPRKMAFKSRGQNDVILGTQTGNPIWRKERNRRQEEGDNGRNGRSCEN